MQSARRAPIGRTVLLAWAAAFAFALLPTVARLAQALAGDAWTEVCSVQGLRWIAPQRDGPERGPLGHLAQAGEHCPLCAAAGPALPTPPHRLPLAVPMARELAGAAVGQPATLRSPWQRALPRAPPRQA